MFRRRFVVALARSNMVERHRLVAVVTVAMKILHITRAILDMVRRRLVPVVILVGEWRHANADLESPPHFISPLFAADKAGPLVLSPGVETPAIGPIDWRGLL